jgi:uncharacterized protein (DUF58 family)
MVRLLVLLAAVAAIVELNDAKPLDQAAIALGVAACLAYLWSRLSVRKLTLVREPLVDHVAVGELFTEQLTLLNGSILPKPWLEALDFSTLPGHAAGQVVRVRGNGAVRWTAKSICRARGEFDLGPVRVRSGDPFGVFTRSVVAPETIRVLVWPVSVSLQHFQEPGGVFSGGPQRGWSPFTSPAISGIREYAPGDPFNRIAWGASARSSQLMVKEFEQDPIADVWVLLDMHNGVHAGRIGPDSTIFSNDAVTFDSTEEYAVAIAASICRTYLERGRSVGLIVTTTHAIVLSPERGEAQITRIMDLLAVTHPDGIQPIAEAIRAHDNRFSRQSSIVVVSPSLDERWAAELGRLRVAGIASQAVLVQPESFGAPAHSLPFIGSLIAFGVPVATVARGDRIDTLSNLDTAGAVHAAH